MRSGNFSAKYAAVLFFFTKCTTGVNYILYILYINIVCTDSCREKIQIGRIFELVGMDCIFILVEFWEEKINFSLVFIFRSE